MSENYKKFQHKNCEYFPCHKGVSEDVYNCLFCYCPLYMLKDACGGILSLPTVLKTALTAPFHMVKIVMSTL